MPARHTLKELKAKYPLSEQLNSIFGSSTKHSRSRVVKRIDVISPKLCEDSLAYIHEELKGYKGCDIIDINPGPCLWSKHIHRVLQPRRHLLMEPECAYHEPFIEPLLKEKDSKYRLSTVPPTHPHRSWDSYNNIFNDDLLPKRDPLPADDLRSRKILPDLLITGNLHRGYAGVRADGFDPYHHARRALMMFGAAGFTNGLFHRYGLVRMLFWIPESSRGDVLPFCNPLFGMQNPWGELAMSTVEVAGPEDRYDEGATAIIAQGRGRPSIIDKFSAIKARQRTEAAGKVIKPSRQLSRYKEAHMTAKLEKLLALVKIDAKHEIVRSVAELEEIVRGLIDKAKSFAETRWSIMSQSHKPVSPKYKAIVESELISENDKGLGDRVGEYMELSKRQVEAEAIWSTLEEQMPAQTRERLRRDLSTSAANISRGILFNGTHAHIRAHERVSQTFDEYRGFFEEPSLLQMDRRPFEAIKVNTDETFPSVPMMLLLVTPETATFETDFSSTIDNVRDMRLFMHRLVSRRQVTVAEALKSISADCQEDLEPLCPSLHDARKGGRLADADLRVNMMTREMRRELINAYFEWPFKPLGQSLAGLDPLEPDTPKLDVSGSASALVDERDDDDVAEYA